MKKLTLIILAAALATTAANADDYYFCFTGSNNHLNFAKIPGPGTHQGLDIVDSFPIGFNSSALTYDGEYWWTYYNQEIYCFDQNGDYVRSFPRPLPTYIDALAWDGQYLWIESYHDLYQRDIYGNIGPNGSIDIYDYLTYCCTIKDDRIIVGNDSGDGVDYCHLEVYDFSGNHLFTGLDEFGQGLHGETQCFGALAYHDGIVWVSYYYPAGDDYRIMGLPYVEGQEWIIETTIENDTVFDLAICDADFINIAESSRRHKSRRSYDSV